MARWRTSTYSRGNNECVEVAGNLPHLVLVSDSKRPASPVVAFGHDAWRAFVGGPVWPRTAPRGWPGRFPPPADHLPIPRPRRALHAYLDWSTSGSPLRPGVTALRAPSQGQQRGGVVLLDKPLS
ncbi:DUF397 domain-containing protein [Streptomyces griseus]|uniref:DUF397 domain-containing protein n=1 Tax=Streptomyces griseus TaxID=1911 RepID=UPI003F69E7AB